MNNKVVCVCGKARRVELQADRMSFSIFFRGCKLLKSFHIIRLSLGQDGLSVAKVDIIYRISVMSMC